MLRCHGPWWRMPLSSTSVASISPSPPLKPATGLHVLARAICVVVGACGFGFGSRVRGANSSTPPPLPPPPHLPSPSARCLRRIGSRLIQCTTHNALTEEKHGPLVLHDPGLLPPTCSPAPFDSVGRCASLRGSDVHIVCGAVERIGHVRAHCHIAHCKSHIHYFFRRKDHSHICSPWTQ